MRYVRQFAVFFVLMVVCGFLLYSSYADIETKTIAQINNEQMVHAGQAASGIEHFFTSYNDSLSFLAGNDHIITLDSDGRELMRDFFASHDSETSSITRVDENGIITYTYPIETSTGANISTQPHVRQEMSTHSVVISDVFTSVQGFRTIAFHMPVFRDGVFKGSIAILIPFDVLAKENLETIHIIDSGYAWTISRSGVVLYSPYPDQVGKPVFLVFNNSPTVTAMAQEAMKGSRGISAYTVSGDPAHHVPSLKFQAIYLPVKIGDTSWSVIVSTPENEILGTLQGFRNTLIVLSALLILSLLFFTYYIARARGIVQEEEIRRKADAALRESEEKYRLLYDNSIDAILLTSPDGSIQAANPAACAIFQRTEEEIIRNGRGALFDSADPLLSTALEERTRTGKFVGELTFLRKDGSRFAGEISSKIFTDRNGNLLTVMIIRDISERRKKEQALQIANQKLNLMNIVAWHDIYNKVTGLRGYVELSRNRITDPKAQEFLAREEEILIVIHQQIQYTQDYQKIGIQPPRWHDLVSILNNVRMANPAGSIHISNEAGNLELFADPVIEKVFFNLIDNSAKHGEKVTEIRITARETESGCTIVYEDNGVGIPENKRKDLFTKSFGTSTGFNLFFVHDILEINGMKIEETGKPGSGARFEITVPKGLYRFGHTGE